MAGAWRERFAGQPGSQGRESNFELLDPGKSRKLVQDAGGEWELLRGQAGELAAPSGGIHQRWLAHGARQLPGHKAGGVDEHGIDRLQPDDWPHTGPTEPAQQCFDAAENAGPDHGLGEEDHRQARVFEESQAQGAAPRHQDRGRLAG